MSLDPQQFRAAARALRDCELLVVLTGAGISRESGIPTYRDALEGIWAQYDPMKLATPRGFRADPRLVWNWYEYRRELMRPAQPNPGHLAIAALEDLLPQVVVVTQNIDGLHHAAHSTDIIELHGNIHRSKCYANCQGDPTLIDLSTLTWNADSAPPRCPYCGAWVRPDVVWFEEALPADLLQRATSLARRAGVMLVAGTSGVVHPAASLPFVAAERGAVIIEVNPEMTPITPVARWHFAGPSGEVLPQLVEALRTLPPAQQDREGGPHAR